MLLHVQLRLGVRPAFPLFVLRLLIRALIPVGLSELARPVAHVLAIHFLERLSSLYRVCEADKAVPCTSREMVRERSKGAVLIPA